MDNEIYRIWVSQNNIKEYFFDIPKQDSSFCVPTILTWLLDASPSPAVEKPDENGFCPIFFVLHSAENFLVGQSSTKERNEHFAQDLLKDDNDFQVSEHKIKAPIIHVIMSDLFLDSLFGFEPQSTLIPRSYMVMDNSIWNYMVPIDGTYYIHDLAQYRQLDSEGKQTERVKHSRLCRDVLSDAIKSIIKNNEKGLYKLKVAREYADLNARLIEESFLSGAHASGVSPFVFHSETVTKQLIQRVFRLSKESSLKNFNGYSEKKSRLADICKYRWRFLLIDDKAIEPMSSIPENNVTCDWNCKLNIIQSILESQLGNGLRIGYKPCNDCDDLPKFMPGNERIIIEYAQNCKDALDAIKNETGKRYDIVLLDYLLNSNNEVHYGYEFLEKIFNDQEAHDADKKYTYYVAPIRNRRLYCMFISAYSSAVYERLLAEGLNQSEEFWHINTGACPTNTPQLFLYNLLKLMYKRMEDSGITELSEDRIISILEDIFIGGHGDDSFEINLQGISGNIRKRAHDKYRDVLTLQSRYYGISQNTESALFQSFAAIHNMGGFLEHITHMIHLVAFGTVRQWPEMWEEFLFIKSGHDRIWPSENNQNRDRWDRLFSGIQAYIMQLK